jgi:hypothetical protein
MLAFEIHAAPTELRILAREMLDMILRPVFDLLPMDPDSSVAVAASDATSRRANRVRYRHVLPAPFCITIDNKLPSLLATRHQIVRHLSLLH